MAAFSTVRSTTFQPKTPPNYLLISLCQTKTAIFRRFFYWFACFSSGSEPSILSCSAKKLLSSSRALLFHLFLILPVPAGTNLPTITFSFKPFNGSPFPLIAASVNTLVVSWKDAAEMNDSVWSEALVIPH